MKFLALFMIAIVTTDVSALDCDCEVRVFSPMTGSNKLPPMTLTVYELESFSTYGVKSQIECRDLCVKKFEKDMPVQRMNALLLSYGKTLIDQGHLGYNCTGLTPLKFPVRVKAKLGKLGLGNVVDLLQVVIHEEACF